MKVQRSITYRLGKEYVKHQLVIPNDTMKQLGWMQGDCLQARIGPKGLLLCKIQPQEKNKEPEYDAFKHAVIETLKSIPNGCNWSELKQKSNLPQLTPSPLWVKRMEDENCLERVRDPVTSKLIWRLANQRKNVLADSTLNGWISHQP